MINVNNYIKSSDTHSTIQFRSVYPFLGYYGPSFDPEFYRFTKSLEIQDQIKLLAFTDWMGRTVHRG